MSLLRRRMMMASSVKEPDVPDTPTEELDYLTIIPLHEEEVEYFINPYADYYHVLPFYYRINKGEWVEVNLSGTSTTVFCIKLNKTKELQLKCNSVEFDPELTNVQNFSIISIGSFSLGGTPMSIIYGDDFNAYDYVPDSFLVSMFANNSGLKSIVNPETFLPYTNVSGSCYVSLFEGCTSLTNSPTLPATTLTYDCYAMMFRGCSNLKHIKMLAKEAKSTSGISIGIEDCLYDWVEGVSSTGTFVKHPDMTSLPTGVDGIPKGWTVVNDGEESGDIDFGIEFPLYIEADYCDEDKPGCFDCYSKSLEEAFYVNLRNFAIHTCKTHGELDDGLYYVDLSLLDIHIFVDVNGEWSEIEAFYADNDFTYIDCSHKLGGYHNNYVSIGNGFISWGY